MTLLVTVPWRASPARASPIARRLGLEASGRGGLVFVAAPERYAPIPGVAMPRLHPIDLETASALRARDVSPLHSLGAIAVGALESGRELAHVVEARWWALVDETDRALARARALVPSAAVAVRPWRIHGVLLWDAHELSIAFSRDGGRGRVTAVDGRAVGGGPDPRWVDVEGSSDADLRAAFDTALRSARGGTAPSGAGRRGRRARRAS